LLLLLLILMWSVNEESIFLRRRRGLLPALLWGFVIVLLEAVVVSGLLALLLLLGWFVVSWLLLRPAVLMLELGWVWPWLLIALLLLLGSLSGLVLVVIILRLPLRLGLWGWLRLPWRWWGRWQLIRILLLLFVVLWWRSLVQLGIGLVIPRHFFRVTIHIVPPIAHSLFLGVDRAVCAQVILLDATFVANVPDLASKFRVGVESRESSFTGKGRFLDLGVDWVVDVGLSWDDIDSIRVLCRRSPSIVLHFDLSILFNGFLVIAWIDGRSDWEDHSRSNNEEEHKGSELGSHICRWWISVLYEM
jgi:hypothetical protein